MNRKALVVGLNKYPQVPLHGCIDDANRVAAVIERNADGSPNFGVLKLTDETQSIGKAFLKQKIEELFIDDNEVALFYFSGHGSITSIGGVIVTPDFEDYNEGISMNDILLYANNSKAHNKIIILDCCYSGKLGEFGDTPNSWLSEGMSILSSSRKYQPSMENNGSGVFTALLVDALYGGAADLRGYITPGSIYSYVDSALGPWAQRPVFKTNVHSFVHLKKVNPPISPEILRQITEYFVNAENEFPLDPSFEYTSNIPNKNNIEIFKKLQKMESVGLVIPCDEEHMYFAAMNSKSCKLTALGYHYWKLVKEGKI